MSKLENADQSKWYAVMVRSQNEFSISRLIEQKLEIKSLVPSQKVWKRRGGKVKVFNKPLFSSYIFVNMDITGSMWKKIYRFNGVLDFVRQNSNPVAIPENQILSAASLANADQPVHEMEYLKRLKINDYVEVIGGPLVGAIGRFIRGSKEVGKFVVSVDLFQRSLVTDVEAALVRPY